MNGLLRTTAFCAVLIALGCEVTNVLSSDTNFGDDYRIVTEDASATPRLDVDGLQVTVQYSGGCKTHRFDVRYQIAGDTTEIWLEHDANGDGCEAYLTEPLTLSISPRALETPNVLLLTPEGSKITLR